MQTLQSPEDEPSEAEEAAVTKFKTLRMEKIEEIDWRLRNSARRTVAYEAALAAANTPERITKAARDLEVERMAQERMLSERERA